MNDMETRIANGFADAKTDATTAENNAKKGANEYTDAEIKKVNERINALSLNYTRTFNSIYTWANANLNWQNLVYKTAPADKSSSIVINLSEIKNKLDGIETLYFVVNIYSNIRDDGSPYEPLVVTKEFPLKLFYDKSTSQLKDFTELVKIVCFNPLGCVLIGTFLNDRINIAITNPTDGYVRDVTIMGQGANIYNYLI